MKIKLLPLLLSAAVLTGCAAEQQEIPVSSVDISISTTAETSASTTAAATSSSAATTVTTPQTTAAPPEPELPKTSSVDIVCAGDNLIHQNIYRQAFERTGGSGYDFRPPYRYVKTYIEEADLAILNQETILSDEFEPSTYPRFCTPTALGDNMVELGFDAISISNNHVLDQGEEGLLSTLRYWETKHPDIPVYGAYKNAEDMADIRTLEVNGITFAFLGYMEHTNGLYLPKGSECEVVYLSEGELMEQQIRAATEKYDCVIVSVHFGVEITNEISQQQYDYAQKFADWGADIIIGTQPHTIQSMEYLTKADGGEAFVFYCLGNLLSSQTYPYSMIEMLGRITVTKDFETGEITLSNPNAVPLINHYDRTFSDVRVYPYKDYTKELAAVHGCDGGLTMEFIDMLIEDNIPKEYLCLD